MHQNCEAHLSLTLSSFYSPSPPRQRPHHAHALFDFTPHHPTQLRFLRGDVIELLDCSDSLRWRGRCHGHVGYFPPEYVQPIYHCQWPDVSNKCTIRSRRFTSEPSRPRPSHCSPALHLTINVWSRQLTNCEWTAYYVTDSSKFPVMPPVNHKPRPISCPGPSITSTWARTNYTSL